MHKLGKHLNSAQPVLGQHGGLRLPLAEVTRAQQWDYNRLMMPMQ